MSDRKEDAVNKVRVIWEAIRRTPRYKKLYALHSKYDKSRAGVTGSYKCLMKIFREFGIGDPIDPSKKSTEVPEMFLHIYFHKGAFEQIAWKDMRYMNLSPDRYIKLPPLTIDMTKSCTQICSEFEIFMKSVKENRRKRGFDKPPHNPEGGKKRTVQSYDIKDFETYDLVTEKRRRNKKVTFYQIAKERLALAGKKAKSFTIDAEGKKLENAYKRAAWLIEGGYRVLM